MKKGFFYFVFLFLSLVFAAKSMLAEQDIWVKTVIIKGGIPFNAGESLAVCCYIQHTSNINPVGWNIVIKVDGNQIGISNDLKKDKNCPTLSNDYSLHAKYSIPASGSYKAECVADPENKILESDEGNNFAETPIYTLDSKTLGKLAQKMNMKKEEIIKIYRMPDLVLDKLEVKPEKNTASQDEYNFLLRCGWKRTGPRPIYPFKLKIWKGSESDKAIIKEADITAEDQIVEANLSAIVKGAVLFHCSIDPENKVQESNEYNNMRTIIFRIAEAPQNPGK